MNPQVSKFSLTQLFIVITGVAIGFSTAPWVESSWVEPIKKAFAPADPFQDISI